MDILTQANEINQTAKRTVLDVVGTKEELGELRILSGESRDDIRDIRTVSGGSKDDIQEIKGLSRSAKDDIQEIKALSVGNKDGILDIKGLSTSAARYEKLGYSSCCHRQSIETLRTVPDRITRRLSLTASLRARRNVWRRSLR